MSHQLTALVALRWRMVRTRSARQGFLALAALAPTLCLAAAFLGAVAPRARTFDVLLLAPSAYLSVATLAVLAPLVAGGGNELFPAEQLVAFPVTAGTQYCASLALTPLNLAWTTQLVALVGLTTFVSEPGPRAALAVLVCLLYVLAVTLAGLASAWLVVGVRQTVPGRRLTWALAATLGGAGLALLVSGRTTAVLDAAPTTWVVVGAVNGSAGGYGSWAVVVGFLVLASGALFVAGRAACGWSLRQPGQGAGGTAETATVRRRGQPASGRRAHLATDRASVWRSTSLRRGLLVLGVLPGLVAAAAGLQWSSLVLLPGLVAAGAGLLFGVNAFCLDGTGAVWLASLPGGPGVLFRAKAQVVAEVCTVAVVLAVAAGATRAGRLPTAAEVAALASCAAATVARVVATCMRLSLIRPHRADLRGPRDTPAPPGAMAAYSTRLATSTMLVAVAFSGLSGLPDWWLSPLLATFFLLLSGRRLVAAHRRWQRPSVRAGVVATLSSG